MQLKNKKRTKVFKISSVVNFIIEWRIYRSPHIYYAEYTTMQNYNYFVKQTNAMRIFLCEKV